MTPGGVGTSANSPSLYLNMSRKGVAPPPTATAAAKPRWVKVTDSRLYAWHDHRIHWMEMGKPAIVRKDPGHAHHLFDWQVPILFGGGRGVIHRQLNNKPLTCNA